MNSSTLHGSDGARTRKNPNNDGPENDHRPLIRPHDSESVDALLDGLATWLSLDPVLREVVLTVAHDADEQPVVPKHS
jgi:hypothetical protein